MMLGTLQWAALKAGVTLPSTGRAQRRWPPYLIVAAALVAALGVAFFATTGRPLSDPVQPDVGALGGDTAAGGGAPWAARSLVNASSPHGAGLPASDLPPRIPTPPAVNLAELPTSAAGQTPSLWRAIERTRP